MADRSLREALIALQAKWQQEALDYPDTTEAGRHCRIAVRLCAGELNEVLDAAEPAGLVVTDQAIAPAARALHEAASARSTHRRNEWHQLSVRQKDRYINDARVALEAAVPFLQGSANQHQDLAIDRSSVEAVLRQRMQNSNFTGVKHEPVRTQVIDQWVEVFADAVMVLSRPVAEVKAEALYQLADHFYNNGNWGSAVVAYIQGYATKVRSGGAS